jgi:glycosyltransferase involved in cell wall biosynthesis
LALAKAIEASLKAERNADALRRRAADFSPERIAEQYLEIFSSSQGFGV